MNMKDDGTGVAAEGEYVDRLKADEECTWLNLGACFARRCGVQDRHREAVAAPARNSSSATRCSCT